MSSQIKLPLLSTGELGQSAAGEIESGQDIAQSGSQLKKPPPLASPLRKTTQHMQIIESSSQESMKADSAGELCQSMQRSSKKAEGGSGRCLSGTDPHIRDAQLAREDEQSQEASVLKAQSQSLPVKSPAEVLPGCRQPCTALREDQIDQAKFATYECGNSELPDVSANEGVHPQVEVDIPIPEAGTLTTQPAQISVSADTTGAAHMDSAGVRATSDLRCREPDIISYH